MYVLLHPVLLNTQLFTNVCRSSSVYLLITNGMLLLFGVLPHLGYGGIMGFCWLNRYYGTNKWPFHETELMSAFCHIILLYIGDTNTIINQATNCPLTFYLVLYFRVKYHLFVWSHRTGIFQSRLCILMLCYSI